MFLIFRVGLFLCLNWPLLTIRMLIPKLCSDWRSIGWECTEPLDTNINLCAQSVSTITGHCITLCDDIQKLLWRAFAFLSRPHEQLDHEGMLLKWFIKSFTSKKMSSCWSVSSFCSLQMVKDFIPCVVFLFLSSNREKWLVLFISPHKSKTKSHLSIFDTVGPGN